MQYDCVSFYRYLETLRVKELSQVCILLQCSNDRKNSLWLFTDEADILFRVAKSRVYTVKRKSMGLKEISPAKKKKSSVDKPDSTDSDKDVLSQDKDASQSEELKQTENKDEPNETPIEPPKVTKPVEPQDDIELTPVLEENPKWRLLKEVLLEIEQEDQKGKSAKSLDVRLTPCSWRTWQDFGDGQR